MHNQYADNFNYVDRIDTLVASLDLKLKTARWESRYLQLLLFLQVQTARNIITEMVQEGRIVKPAERLPKVKSPSESEANPSVPTVDYELEIIDVLLELAMK